MQDPFSLRVVMGLGNPGASYARTYHNVGMLAVDYFLEHYAAEGNDITRDAGKTFLLFRVKSLPLVFIKPTIFMNESGRAAREALTRLKASPAELLVIHDDADLPLGAARLVFGRGSAGHHGIDSLFRALGSRAFWRLRIGIRNPRAITKQKAEALVLRPLSPRALATLYRTFAGSMATFIEKETPVVD